MNHTISVIVPVYGIESYIGTCIESIIKQTYTNLEIILVDDGSPDKCPEICDLYKKKDSRIKVIHKPNGGLVSARKAGLKEATGTYVGYVDGDDWVEPVFYESLYNAIIETNSDIAISGYCKDLFGTTSEMKNNISSGLYQGETLTKVQENMLSYKNFFKIGITTYVWNKLFKRELLLKHQNNVPNEITIGEDAAVVYPYIMDCKSIRIIDSCYYHYLQRADSMLKRNASFSKEAVGLRKLYSYLVNFAGKYPSTYRLKEQVTDFMLGTCIMRSGGIVNKPQDHYFSYDKDFYGSNVVICNAGTFGQSLVYRIKENNYCNIVGWIDVDYLEYRRCFMDVEPIDSIYGKNFDYVLIATVCDDTANLIKTNFIEHGIPKEKIVCVYCPEENREYLLQKILEV